jgi:hypothetical protein
MKFAMTILIAIVMLMSVQLYWIEQKVDLNMRVSKVFLDIEETLAMEQNRQSQVDWEDAEFGRRLEEKGGRG